MTPREELIEMRQQFNYARRQLEAWVIFGMISFFLMMATLTRMILPRVLPSNGGERAVLSATVGTFTSVVSVEPKFPCSAHGIYIFGYRIFAGLAKAEYQTEGTVCWDIFKKRWEWSFRSKPTGEPQQPR